MKYQITIRCQACGQHNAVDIKMLIPGRAFLVFRYQPEIFDFSL